MDQSDFIPELRPIPGFPGYYASRCGWIWTTISRPCDGIKGIDRYKADSMPPRRMACPVGKRRNFLGYRVVRLMIQGEQRYNGPIHRLILMAFTGPPPHEDSQGAHDNGNSLDNRSENLLWKSPLENNRDRHRHGTVPHVFGESHWNSKLTNEIVLSIRSRYAAGGITQKTLAEEHGLHQVTVSEIVLRKIWPHI